MSRYIDADKMADELSKVPWYEQEDRKQAVRMVKEFPAADVAEVKRGRWKPIVRGENGYSAGDFRCSECGKPNKCYSLTIYCPNCGSRMDLDEVTE